MTPSTYKGCNVEECLKDYKKRVASQQEAASRIKCMSVIRMERCMKSLAADDCATRDRRYIFIESKRLESYRHYDCNANLRGTGAILYTNAQKINFQLANPHDVSLGFSLVVIVAYTGLFNTESNLYTLFASTIRAQCVRQWLAKYAATFSRTAADKYITLHGLVTYHIIILLWSWLRFYCLGGALRSRPVLMSLAPHGLLKS